MSAFSAASTTQSRPQLGRNPVLAIAGPDTLTLSEFKVRLDLQSDTDISAENVQPFLENWVSGMLLYREAVRRGLGQDETTQLKVVEFKRQYLIQLLGQQITDSVRASDNEVFDYYTRRRADFVTRLRFQYMALPDEKTARATMKDLKQGKSFEILAQERSLYRAQGQLPEATITGRGDSLLNLDPVLEDTLFTLKQGELSPPIKAASGWWLVKVLSVTHLSSTAPPLDSVRGYISDFLGLMRKRAILERNIAALRKKARVVTAAPRGDTSGFLASVGSSVLTRHYLELRFGNQPSLDDRRISQLVETWIGEELLYQEAMRLGLDTDRKTQMLFQLRVQNDLDNLIIEQLTDNVVITTNQAFDYFRQHKEEFLYDVSILHILAASPDTAQAMLTELQKGADFQDMASARSLDRAAAQGRESRLLDRIESQANLNPLLENVIFTLKPGDLTPVLHTREGYWIIKAVDRKQVRNDITFDQGQTHITDFLRELRQQQLLDDFVAGLRQATFTQVFPANYTN